MTQGAKIIKRKVGEIKNHSSFETRLRRELIKIHQLLNGAGNWDATKLFDLVSRTRGDAQWDSWCWRLRDSERNSGAQKQKRGLSTPGGEGWLSATVGGRESSRQQNQIRVLLYSSSVPSMGCRTSYLHPSLPDEDCSLESKRGRHVEERMSTPFWLSPIKY